MMTVCEGVFAIMLLLYYAITMISITDLVYVHLVFVVAVTV